jgi:hypothetical protein
MAAGVANPVMVNPSTAAILGSARSNRRTRLACRTAASALIIVILRRLIVILRRLIVILRRRMHPRYPRPPALLLPVARDVEWPFDVVLKRV